jgi:hypothetical protein
MAELSCAGHANYITKNKNIQNLGIHEPLDKTFL